MYAGDPDFSQEHYTFMKLGRHDLCFNPAKNYHIISELDFPTNLPEPHYAELAGMYCVYKNNIHKGLDYIGFSHYDKEHRLLCAGDKTDITTLEATRNHIEVKQRQGDGPCDITRRINGLVNGNAPRHICLEAHDSRKIYDQRVLMDKRQPDQFVGEGRNCLDEILVEYNRFFGTGYSMLDVEKDGFLNMCDCFVTPVFLFDKLMSFVASVIENGSLDIYDTKRRHRLQGGLLERYVAVFFALERINKTDLTIIHRYWDKKKSDNNFVRRLLKKMFVKGNQ
jgi:hypothetical protein